MKRRLSALAAVLAAALLLGGLPGTPARAESEQTLQTQLDKLEQEAARLRRQAKETRENLSEQTRHMDTLSEQIHNLNEQLALLDSRLDKLDGELAGKDEDIRLAQKRADEKEAALAGRREALAGKLRAVSKSGNFSTLQMLADVENYADYLIKSKALSRIAQRDGDAIREMEDAVREVRQEQIRLETAKGELADKKAETAALRAKAEGKKGELDSVYKEVRQVVRRMESDKAVLDKNLRENERMQAQLDHRIAELNKTPSTAGDYKTARMYWPVPTVHTLSSRYGWREGRMHKGIDIANHPTIKVYGQNVVAAADGVVLLAYTRDKVGGGYGYHVIVDHGVDAEGRRITTMSAHLSKVFVATGQKVTGGRTVLGQAGDTGRVDGPHLHFEVRVNNAAVDPIKNGYVKP